MTTFAALTLIVSAVFLGVTQAESNSTASNTTMVRWVSPAPRQICSWKCVHLNIPTHEEIQGEWHTMQICRCIPDISIWPKAPLRRKWSRKIIWMTVIALGPEFGVALAAKQYMDARQELKEFTKALSNEVLKQTYLAQRSDTFTVEVQPDMFRIPEFEIKDLSKADVITKAFAITQCTWLIVQSISRVAHEYSISLLELATLAFIFCAFIMHIFWWNKPFDVESRRVVTAIGLNPKVPPNLSTFSMDDLTVSKNFRFRERVKDLSWQRFEDLIAEISEIIDPADTSRPYIDYLPSASLYIASATFLAIHLAAWNRDFPSSVVRSLWRWLNLSTLVTSFAPLILGFLYSLGPRRGTFEKFWSYLHHIEICGSGFDVLLSVVDARECICHFGLVGVGPAFLIGACKVDNERLDTGNDCAVELVARGDVGARVLPDGDSVAGFIFPPTSHVQSGDYKDSVSP
ncbi:uncharacterized protein FOBCDRAFT_208097 [Fusarium oxysporum Fo47]|uniref:uncharacterized protein n=1 Tax=Fusarium oxysporum Fo47 TaxID=660027 RepID=UPI002869A6BB|nr:uncharacterized protein FOBCDRAFT_208097 [Fusarium oxysporum Fo47]QKD61415.2 hypothetical protein FOBCDRAFT_208097 [Fusarium oxysporum Fo47]